MDGLEMGPFTLICSSSQSEEKHQQCVSPHLLQYSQYLPKKVVCSFTTSDSVWGCNHCIHWVCEDLWWILESLAYRYICFRSTIFCLHIIYLAGCPPLFGYYMTSLGLSSCAVLLHFGVGILKHIEFFPCGLNFDLYL